MVGKTALALLVILAMPAADALAQDKSKAKGKGGKNVGACIAAAKASCPPYGVNSQTCQRAAVARCRQGG